MTFQFTFLENFFKYFTTCGFQKLKIMKTLDQVITFKLSPSSSSWIFYLHGLQCYRQRGGKFFSMSTEDSSADSEATSATLVSAGKSSVGLKASKQRWSGFFANTKGTKMDVLSELLDSYLKHGIPRVPETQMSYDPTTSEEGKRKLSCAKFAFYESQFVYVTFSQKFPIFDFLEGQKRRILLLVVWNLNIHFIQKWVAFIFGYLRPYFLSIISNIHIFLYVFALLTTNSTYPLNILFGRRSSILSYSRFYKSYVKLKPVIDFFLVHRSLSRKKKEYCNWIFSQQKKIQSDLEIAFHEYKCVLWRIQKYMYLSFGMIRDSNVLLQEVLLSI